MSAKKSIFANLKFFFLFLALLLLFLPQIFSLPLFKNSFFYLLGKSKNCFIQAESASFSWFSYQKLKKLQFKTSSFQLSADELVFKKSLFQLLRLKPKNFLASGSAFRIENGRLRLFEKKLFSRLNGYFKNGTDNLHVNLTGENILQKNFFLQGAFTRRANSQNGSFYIENCPSYLLDSFFGSKDMISSFAGQDFDTDISFQLKNRKGPCNINLKSDQCQASLPLIYASDGIRLQEKTSLQLQINSERFHPSSNPFPISYFKSRTPAILTIYPNGFYLPLPFDVKKMQMQTASLNLGKIRIKNTKNMALFIGFLKEIKLARSKKVDLCFSPAPVSLENGFLNFPCLAIAIGPLPFRAAGKIDLGSNKIDMFLGLPAELLKKSFKIRSLPANYTLTFPFSGSFKKLKINKKQAAAKIASLIAMEQKSIFKQKLKQK